MLASGVFLNPMGSKLYLSLAHADAGIAEFIDQFARALEATRTARPRTADEPR